MGRLAKSLSRAYEQDSDGGDLTKVFAKLKNAGGPDLRDAWGTELRMEPVPGIGQDDVLHRAQRGRGPAIQYR